MRQLLNVFINKTNLIRYKPDVWRCERFIHNIYLFIYSVHRKNVISQLYAQIKKKLTSEWFEANEGYINENNIYLNVIFGILFVGVASNKFLVWHFELTKSLSRYCISYCNLYTTIHKWEKYHWIWHHIIHPSRQVTLMWNFFFLAGRTVQHPQWHRCMRFINALNQMTNAVVGLK